jgi:predicted RNA-binding Zn-ribbon protein involved in translation (DUF1610 family)
MTVFATVAVHTDEHGVSRFKCPNCERTIRYTNSFPLAFNWKVCPGCRWQWIPDRLTGIGPHAKTLAGQTNDLSVFSTERPV